MDKLLIFLKELSENNNRDWFQANKEWYEESRKKVVFLTDVLINEIGQFDSQVKGISSKDCIFRIFRDVRFSKDKRPYKTNFGSFICKEGRKSMNPGYYFHIEPGGSFIGGGIYMPPAQRLKAIRNYMADYGEGFMEITNALHFKKEFPEMYDDKLKIAPKGFPKDHKFIHLLRYKSFSFLKNLTDEQIKSDDYIKSMVQSFSLLKDVNTYLYDAIAE